MAATAVTGVLSALALAVLFSDSNCHADALSPSLRVAPSFAFPGLFFPRYLKDCGDCEVKKDEGGEEVLCGGAVGGGGGGGGGGGLPHYGGPWSASQYARDPAYLGTVKTQSETMDADDLDALLWSAKGAMEPSEYKATVAQVAKDMGADLTRTGLRAREDGRSKWLEKLEERFAPLPASPKQEGGSNPENLHGAGAQTQRLLELEDENDRLRALLAKYESSDPASVNAEL
jgi:hypothetical protein